MTDGQERHVPPKAFDLLMALIEARPKVLRKAALLARVWPDTFVSEANLAVLVGDIRAALGDSACDPRFIRTHHGVGYSFIGQVDEVSPSVAGPRSGATWVLQVGARRILVSDGVLRVGRDPRCDVVLQHRSVSRFHARLRVTAAGLTVHDESSKNGTFVDGVAATDPLDVSSGQHIVFGSVRARAILERPETSTLTTSRTGAVTRNRTTL